MLESVKTSGVHEPIIVRDMGDGSPYQILSGNHCNIANIEAGNEDIIAIVLREISHAYAAEVFSNANIIRSQRGDFIPSELAKIYKMSLDAEKEVRKEKIAKGEKRGNPVGDKLAEDYKVSKTGFYRYIRLLDLVPEFMDMVDNEDISIRNADLISCLPENQQMELYTSLLEVDMQLSDKITEKLNALHKEGNLTTLNIKDYLIAGKEKSNQHLQDKSLSLKAKGLLSLMLSLPETWEYTLQGLAAICKDGVSSVTSAIQELEEAGYLVRQRTRTMSGRLGNIEYFIYEETQNNGCDNNQDKKIAPLSHIPKDIKPKYEKPTQVKHPQSNTKILNTKESNTNQSIYQETAIEQDSYDENQVDVMDEMENIAIYEDLVKENIAFDNLCHDNPLRVFRVLCKRNNLM